MNVATEPWIPVLNNAGGRELVSLISVFTEGDKFADLAVRPHERVALMRLFLCIAHVALDGPRNITEWYDAPAKLPEAVRIYLTKWESSFELFHETKPWLQVAALTSGATDKNDNPDNEKGWSSLNKLCFTRASGNTSTLFDHEANGGQETKYLAEEIVLNLLTFQNFFVAGGKASTRFWGDIEMANPPNPRGGPCSGKSILFTFLRGADLFKSIILNLNTYEDLKLIYGDSENWLGKPLWEMPINSPCHHEAVFNATKTHLGRLVPQTRILKVNEDCQKVLLGAGFIYPKFQDEKNPFHPDIFATMVLNSEGERELLSAKSSSSIWRELHSLTVRRRNALNSCRGPLCLMNTQETQACDIIVNAMITNPKQAAEIMDLIESVFHIPTQLFTLEGNAAYESEVKYSELYMSRLGWAIENYRKVVDGGWKGRLKGAGSSKGELKAKLHSIAATHYWTSVENNLSLLMSHIEHIGTDDAIPSREAWRKMLFSSACDSYRVACGQETPRQMKAFAIGWQKLTTTKYESESNNTGTQEVKE